MRISRNLSSDNGRCIKIYLEGPIKSDDTPDYYCNVGICSVDRSRNVRIYGLDEFQALILALRQLQFIVERFAEDALPERIYWDCGQDSDPFGLSVEE